jgi:hypothetical protein
MRLIFLPNWYSIIVPKFKIPSTVAYSFLYRFLFGNIYNVAQRVLIIKINYGDFLYVN